MNITQKGLHKKDYAKRLLKKDYDKDYTKWKN